MNLKIVLSALLILALLGTSNVQATENDDDNYDYNYASLSNRCQVYDPYESINRKLFIFNSVLDTIILRPVAKGYGKITNDFTRQRVNSFVGNISEPLSSVNYGIQGNANGVFKTFWRFAINSTFGILGMFDVAGKFGLTAEPQTFSNTLANYGVGQGPYLVVPFFGGMGARDLMDPIILNATLNPAKYPMHRDFKYALSGTKLVHNRNQIMPFTDYISKNSTDPYIAVRDAILQQREAKMVYPKGFKCPKVNNQ